MSESPFRRAYWTGRADARPLAIFRILLGVVLLADWGVRLGDFHAFYTRTGFVPTSPSFWPGGAEPVWVDASVFALGGISALALVVGFVTQGAVLGAFLYCRLLEALNPLVQDGGDAVIRLLLFWSLFSDLGAVWSLDARRRGPRPLVPALPVRALQWQVIAIYLSAGSEKLAGAWASGIAIHNALHYEAFARWFAPFLAHSFLATLLINQATIVFELAFAPLVLIGWVAPSLRAVGLLSMLAMHVGIFFTLRVGVFSFIMPSALTLFLMTAWIDRVAGTRPEVVVPPLRKRDWLLSGAALFHLVLLAVWFGLMQSGPRRQTWLVRYIANLGLNQRWSMFAPDPPRANVRILALAQLADGSTRDILPETIPSLARTRVFPSNRWRRIHHTASGEDRLTLELLGSYLCRRYALTHGPDALTAFDLAVEYQPTAPPGEALDPIFLRVAYHQPCR